MNLFLLYIFHLRRVGQYRAEYKALVEPEKQRSFRKKCFHIKSSAVHRIYRKHLEKHMLNIS